KIEETAIEFHAASGMAKFLELELIKYGFTQMTVTSNTAVATIADSEYPDANIEKAIDTIFKMFTSIDQAINSCNKQLFRTDSNAPRMILRMALFEGTYRTGRIIGALANGLAIDSEI